MSFIGLSPESWDPSVPPPLVGEGHTGVLIDGVEIASIASMGRRLAAYVVDLLVVAAIQLVFTIAGHALPTGITNWHAILASTLLLFCYMTVSQAVTYNTIGKYILGILVVNDSPGGTPSPWRIVIRETIGRLLSMQGFMGYYMASRDPRRQAWSDQLAETVVVRRNTNLSLQRGMVIGVTFFFLGTFGLVVVTGAVRQRKAAVLAREISLESRALDQLIDNIEDLRLHGKTLAEFQDNSRRMLPLLDQLQQSLRRVQGEVFDFWQMRPAGASSGQAAQTIYSILLERSAVIRQQANLVLSYEAGTPLQTVRSDLAPLNSQLVQLDRRLAGAVRAAKLAGQKKVR